MTKPTIKLDASTAKELACPHKFWLVNINGYRRRVPSIALEFGQAFHRSVAARLCGQSREDAILVGVTYLANSGAQPGDKDVRTPGKLVEMLTEYFNLYDKFDMFQVAINDDKEPAVELSFELPFYTGTACDVVLCGVIDALGTWNRNTLCFKDIKTTSAKSAPSAYFKSYEVSMQMMLYSYILKTKGFTAHYPPCVIDGVFIRSNSIYERSPLIDFRPDLIDELVEWLYDQCRALDNYMASGQWRRNFSFCNANFSCDFQDVCTAQVAYRTHLLASQFEQREYNPATFGD
jgi:hypothetical protein